MNLLLCVCLQWALGLFLLDVKFHIVIQMQSFYHYYHYVIVWLVLIRVSFTESIISFNFNGVISKIGKYTSAKILTALAYMCNCEINSLYISIYVFYSSQI